MNYTDPRWQRKRLEIFQRDNFKCLHCIQGDKTLNVHHAYYIPGRDLWEYPNWSLLTLCDECHKWAHECGEILNAWELAIDDEILRLMEMLFDTGASDEEEEEIRQDLKAFLKTRMAKPYEKNPTT